MATPFPGHASPGAGFEVPLEMLAACHLRIERQGATLQRLARHVAAHGADADARRAAAAVMRYFDTSARDHHADEEADLFPALDAAGADAGVRALTDALSADHRELERHWQALRAVLARIAAGEPAAFGADAVAAFTGLYARHIAREEAELLPLARRVLGEIELDRVGRAMRERRGVRIDDAAPDDAPAASAGSATDRGRPGAPGGAPATSEP